jgi:hypothetical protein
MIPTDIESLPPKTWKKIVMGLMAASKIIEEKKGAGILKPIVQAKPRRCQIVDADESD